MIYVSNHAIKAYREKMLAYSEPDKEIIEILYSITRLGKYRRPRPGDAGEVKYNNYSIVVARGRNNQDDQVVITFLGDTVYRQWARKTKYCPVIDHGFWHKGRFTSEPTPLFTPFKKGSSRRTTDKIRMGEIYDLHRWRSFNIRYQHRRAP